MGWILLIGLIIVGVLISKRNRDGGNSGDYYSERDTSDNNNATRPDRRENDYNYIYTDQTIHGIGTYDYVDRNEYNMMVMGAACEEGKETDSGWNPNTDGNGSADSSSSDNSSGNDSSSCDNNSSSNDSSCDVDSSF